MRVCSYTCEASDSSKAQHKACHTGNGVYCCILNRIVDKCAECPVSDDSLEIYIKDRFNKDNDTE